MKAAVILVNEVSKNRVNAKELNLLLQKVAMMVHLTST